jgi:2-keto-4-pentenoate hydratase/2-oxohepta-3-ene-1,7-dioic acid hydratase in catechol pathway
MDRIYRVSDGGQPFYVAERDGQLRRLTFPAGHIGADYTLRDVVDGGLPAVRVLAPVRPSKMVCVGQNYLDHIAELKKSIPTEPVLFLKPPTTVLDPGQPIKLPPGVGRVDHEAELAVVIGRRAHRVAGRGTACPGDSGLPPRRRGMARPDSGAALGRVISGWGYWA